MIKLNKRILLLALFHILIVNLAFGQHYSDKFITHKIVVNEPSHKIEAYVKPVKNVYTDENRLYYWFSAGKIHTTQGGFSGKLLNGSYQDFYLNKNLKESGNFSAGLKTGKWKTWNETGVLKEESTWSLSKKNGNYSKYDSLGRIAETGKYRNGLLNGKQKTFKGDSTKIVYYKRGKITEHKSIIPAFIRNIFSKKPDSNKPLSQNKINPQI